MNLKIAKFVLLALFFTPAIGWSAADHIRLKMELTQTSSTNNPEVVSGVSHTSEPMLNLLSVTQTEESNRAEFDQTMAPWKLQVTGVDKKGKQVFSTIIDNPAYVRIEDFDPGNGELQSSGVFMHKHSQLSIDIPANKNIAYLLINAPEQSALTDGQYSLTEVGRVDVADLQFTAEPENPVAPSSLPNVTSLINNGSASNRVDIVFLGDGYTASELTTYADDVQKVVDGIFNEPPFSTYAGYFNVHRVDVISNESGIDHPERGEYKDSAINSYYNCANVQRLICTDYTAANNIANSVMASHAREIVIVLVNDTEYGGSGGSIPVISKDSATVELFLHEVGHSFGLLADEYDHTNSLCNTNEPAELNVTSKTSFAEIKWKHWLDESTPLPTSVDTGEVGLFQGARYCLTALYRPTYNSKMRALYRPFEAVNEEALIKRIYAFVSPIDNYQPTQTQLTLSGAENKQFSVSALQNTSQATQVEWYVDGHYQSSDSDFVFNASHYQAGRHTVSVEVVDLTEKVIKDDGLLYKTINWDVTVENAVAKKNDFNGDGMADLLWHNFISGTSWMHQVQENKIIASNFVSNTPNLWKIAGIDDFNGDGKADILWRNPFSAHNWMHMMSGKTIIASQSFPLIPRGWDVAGTGDFNGDGFADILWRNPSNGKNWMHLLQGNQVIFSQPINTIPSAFKVVSTEDFDGDGKADILWRNTSNGLNWLHLMSGTSIKESHAVNVISTDWELAGSGDFNRDNKADLLWRHMASGQNWMHFMDGHTIQSSRPVNKINPEWAIDIVADFDGDGRSDIFWRNQYSGKTWMHFMNENRVVKSLGINTVSDLNWKPQSK